MKLNTFLSIAAVVAGIFGLAFFLAPVQIMSIYGITLDISGHYIGRYLGSAYLGIACLIWLARKAKPNDDALRAILVGGFILCLAGLVVSVLDKIYGGGNNLVWANVIIYLLLGAGFGYFVFRKSATS